MAITAIAPWFVPTFLDNSGNPLNGGLIYTYVAGTPSTDQATYSDENLSVPISNPIVLNSAGRPQASSIDTTEVNIYLSKASYKFVLKTSAGVTLKTADNVEALASILYVDAAIATQTSPTITTPTIVSPTINTSILSASALLAGICNGRLTLTTAVPVTTADVTAATTVYFAPYGGNNIALYDGVSTWTILPFTEKTLALGTLTSGLPYDVFAYNNAGVVALRSPVAWTNTTTRATALTTQNGILVKTGATTDRYLGTFQTASTTTTEDSYAKRYLWNYYNRVSRPMRAVESTNTWTYTSAAYQQANASTANQLDAVIGVAEVLVEAQVYAKYSNSGPNPAYVSIGQDSTTTPATGVIMSPGYQVSNTQPVLAQASLKIYPAVGRHTWVWLEGSTAAGTTTWYGDDNVPTQQQFGIHGTIQG